MNLSQLIRDVPLTNLAGADVPLTTLTCDTRNLAPGGLFAALRGERDDGHNHIAEALARGAAAILCETPPDHPGPWLVAEDSREAYAQLCAIWFDSPGEKLKLVGVTGTNGKTTTTYLLKHVLEDTLRTKVGLIGTNQILIGDRALPAERTTPDPYTLQCLLAQMVREGCTYVVMEVSSHALSQKRAAGLTFACGVFTNLTRDHLDYHRTMEAYFQAKRQLFDQCEVAVINLDDPAGQQLAKTVPCPVHTFGQNRGDADLVGRAVRLRPDRVSFLARGQSATVPVTIPIPGGFTVSNALGVLSCARILGVPLTDAARSLSRAPGVKGRAEVVPVPAPYTVLIDYAHTPDALEKILQTARDVTQCRLICLFGCGGARDRSKRPIMGEIAAELSDVVILTSDNPRTEDPNAIMKDIAKGFPKDAPHIHREPDRRKAIRAALTMARAGDVILLAGKGHETYQEVDGKRNHFDEREEISSFFQKTVLR